MAFEVFDDVASFWFLLTVVGMVAVPRGLYLLVTWLKGRAEEKNKRERAEKGDKAALDDSPISRAIEAKRKKVQTIFTAWNIIWALSMVTFLVMCLYIPSFQGKSMIAFNAFEILELDPSATPEEIKRAYLKLSLKTHPDKNPGDENAAQKFILVKKAYDTLTDEQTRRNYEQYGNPDGFKGTSVTIGLPSFLMRKENEKLILLVYLIGFLALPIVVGLWWRRAEKISPSGASWWTVGLYDHFIQDEEPGYLLEVLAASEEFKQSSTLLYSDAHEKAVHKLFVAVQDSMLQRLVKRQVTSAKKRRIPHQGYAYLLRTNVLLHSYLLGETIDQILLPELEYVLYKMPMMMEVMIGVAARKGLGLQEQVRKRKDRRKEKQQRRRHGGEATPKSDATGDSDEEEMEVKEEPEVERMTNMEAIANCLTISQSMFQGLWLTASGLQQLPHMSEREADMLSRKHQLNLQTFKALTPSARAALLKDWNPKQLREMELALDYIPTIRSSVRVEVVGEEKQAINVGDVVTIHFSMQRQQRQQSVEESAAQLKSATASASKSFEDAKKAAQDAKDGKVVTKVIESDESIRAKGGPLRSRSSVKDIEEEDIDVVEGRLPDLDDEGKIDDPLKLQFRGFDPKKSRTSVLKQRGEAPVIYSKKYPFPKREVWYVFLVEHQEVLKDGHIVIEKRIIQFYKLKDFENLHEMEIEFPVRAHPDKTKRTFVRRFDLYMVCDSYKGCDKKIGLNVTIHQYSEEEETKLKEEIAAKEKAIEERRKKEKEKEEEEANSGKWYLMGASSTGELILVVVVVFATVSLLQNFLRARGWNHLFAYYVNKFTWPIWDYFLTPLLTHVIEPAWAVARPFIVKYLVNLDAYEVPEDDEL